MAGSIAPLAASVQQQAQILDRLGRAVVDPLLPQNAGEQLGGVAFELVVVAEAGQDRALAERILEREERNF